MVSIAALTEHYKQAFTEQQAKILVEGAAAIEHDLVNREDFSKLTATVERLADRMDSLAAAQERTDEQMTRLAAAQERTDGRMDQLAHGMDQLTHRMYQLAESQQSMQRTFERFMVRTEEQFTSVRQELRETTGALEKKMDASFADVRDFFSRVNRVRSRLDCDDVRVLFFGYRAAPETHGMIDAEGGWLALPAGILRINRQAG
jgi:septation ring formation regulator EzrA